MHGLGLVIQEKVKLLRAGWCSMLLTVSFFAFSLIFFRLQSFEMSTAVVAKIFSWNQKGIHWIYTGFILWLPVVVLVHILRNRLDNLKLSLTNYWGAFVATTIILAVLFLKPINLTPFIYFQF
jgi:hypothetical protein